jgi:hypothetical protein
LIERFLDGEQNQILPRPQIAREFSASFETVGMEDDADDMSVSAEKVD